ncbi:dTDP-4-dehydrorhamnose 3,5-epimerase [Patescibacteria group bacterium]|nr:dTDP-4-dehydrorhamnose 3,5-epimerase [Patescibacteria group bacterium]MBU0963466.1 dTDP-4-dehydrorhamnose 3,5-epimerase [Patescibacteria group bacterium]
MKFKETKFNDAWLIEPDVYKDTRGFFMETFSKEWFEEKGIKVNFVQDNHSKSVKSGVLRGLHFQLPPHNQAKLVRVCNGAVYDVVVDLRKDSETFGQWEGFELTANNHLMFFIPRGFAHGYCTLQPNTEFLYKIDNLYSPEYDTGIIWNDPILNIKWPISNPIISDKDAQLQSFKQFKSPF